MRIFAGPYEKMAPGQGWERRGGSSPDNDDAAQDPLRHAMAGHRQGRFARIVRLLR